MSVSINLMAIEPGGRVLPIPAGVFISVDFTDETTVILPGFNAVAAARAMAAKLTALADEAEAMIAERAK